MRVRISSWSITSLFLANCCLMRARTACVLAWLSTILPASLRQSRKMRRTERFYTSWAGFIKR